MDERELVQKFSELRSEVLSLKEELKSAQTELESTEAKLLELLDSDGKDATAVYEGIGQVKQQKPQLYASVLAENREKLAQYLESVKRSDMVTPYVFPKTLSSFVKEQIESGAKMPEFIQYYLKPSIRFYKP